MRGKRVRLSMTKNKCTAFRKISFLYLAIAGFINATISVATSLIPSPVMDETTVQKWLQFVTRWNPYVIATTFTTPIIFCLIFILRRGTEEKIERRAVSLPTVMAAASLGGWGLNSILLIPLSFLAKSSLGISIRIIVITILVGNILIGISSFTCVYLILERLNQKLLLPIFFPNGKVSSVHVPFRPTFRVLLFMSFIVSTFLPISYLVYGITCLLMAYDIPMHKGLLFVVSFLLVFAILISLMLSRKIVRPLERLTSATKRIAAGDYTEKLSIITNDEMGNLADTFNDMTESLAEKEFMRDTFGKVVDPEVRDYLLNDRIPLHGESRDVTVLFCDIRNFTAMSEKMSAEDVVSLLNRYFTTLGNCIAENHGIINKYIGDAIMAVFGAPVARENHALDAFHAAIAMRKALADFNQVLASESKSPLAFGIGIHTGPVFAGTIGAQSRMEYTIIGDTVNTASRMESLCKTYKTDVLLSGATASRLGESQNLLVPLDVASIRGKEETVQLFTILDRK